MVDDSAILGEIDAYGPLIPGRDEWKATLYIEIPDESRLKVMLPRLPGVEHSVYARCGTHEVRAQGEEGRSREDYTSTVHYLGICLTPDFIGALRSGAPLAFGVRHPHATAEVDAPGSLRMELLSDLEN